MKKVLLSTLILTLAVSMVVMAADEAKGNENCPIMGGKVNAEVYVDYKDMRVFFCCAGCDDTFMKDPEKYIEEMKAKGDEPMKLAEQSVCPVSGEELVSRDVYVDAEGKRVYVCCEGCIGKVKEDPEKYMKVIAERGEYLEDAPEDEKSE